MKYCFQLLCLSLTITVVSFSQIPTNGLVGYWPFNGNANDESGNGKNGSPDGVSLTVDRFGKDSCSYNFDGVNDYINLGDNFNNVVVPFSISAWIFKSSSNGPFERFFVSDDFSTDYYYGFFLGVSGTSVSIEYGNGGYAQSSSRRSKWTGSVFTYNNWNHIVAVVRGATDMTIYVNGQDVGGTYSGSGGSMVHNSLPATIGRLRMRPDYFKGILDDIFLYNRALTTSEISLLYHMNGWNGMLAYTSSVYDGYPAVSPDGTTLAWEQSATDTTYSNIMIGVPDSVGFIQTGTNLTNNTPGTIKDLHPVWRKSNYQEIYFISNRNGTGELYKVNKNSGQQTNIISCGSGQSVSDPTFSPDGSQIIVDFNDNGTRTLKKYNSDGSNPQSIWNNSFTSELYPDWSPDGNYIIFTANNAIYRIKPDGTDSVKLYQCDSTLYHARWSPDGKWIAYNADSVNFDIYIIKPEGTNRIKLTSGIGNKYQPVWDGVNERLYYDANPDGQYDIFWMNVSQYLAPLVPNNLAATEGNKRITLKWSKSLTKDILRHRIYYGMSTSKLTLIDSTTQASDTSLTITGLTNGQQFYFRVTAVDNSGNESGYSSEVNASPHIINGLVAYYPFNGDAKDESGSGYDGTPHEVTLMSDRFGRDSGAYNFDGISSRIELGNWFSLNVFSVSIWVKPASSQNTYANIIDNNHGPYRSWAIQQSGDTVNQMHFGVGIGSPAYFNLYAGIWQHVVAVKDSGKVRVYVDGVIIDSNSTPGVIDYDGTQQLGLGSKYDPVNMLRFWSGRMDDLRLFNRALNQTDIDSLYHEGGYSGNGSIKGVVFNDINGNGIRDGGDTLLANWKIYLRDNQNNLIDSTVTDTSTGYSFYGLADGNYIVSEAQRDTFIQTKPTGLGIYNVTISSGTQVTDKDFGNTYGYRYIGSNYGRWSDSTNWTGGFPPGPSNAAVIPKDTTVLVDSITRDTILALSIEKGAKLQFTNNIGKLNILNSVHIAKYGTVEFLSAADTTNLTINGDWVNRGSIIPGYSTISLTGNQPKVIASDGGNNTFYNLEILGDSTNAVGNVTVQNQLLLQYDLGLSDTLFITNPNPNAIIGIGVIPSGTIRRDITASQAGLYRFESDSTYIKFTNTGYYPPNIGITTYPATNPLTVSTVWNIVGGVVDTSANTIKVQTSLRKSRWAIGIPRLRTGTGTGKVAQDPWLVNRLYAVSLSGKTDSMTTISLRYNQSEVPSGLSEGSLVLMQAFDPMDVTRVVEKNWNLISVPVTVTVSDSRKDSLFPPITSNAFKYQGGYIACDTLINGLGYWLKFDNSKIVNLIGLPIFEDTINVLKGWNLIGSISYPVALSEVGSIPSGIVASNLYRYQNGYSTTDIIQPGYGYWLKVNQDGGLVLSSKNALKESEKIKIVPTSEQPPSPPISEITDEIPKSFALEQNYPNPFNPSTTIQFDLPKETFVTLKIYNILGQEVTTLVNDLKQAGRYKVEWKTSKLASGMYYYWFNAGGYCVTKKLVLLK